MRYRHVELSCGGHVLSEADNWYVPSRLTADMNIRLDRTDKPFGVVVKTMDFRRRTLAVQWRVKSVGHGPRSGRGASPPHIVLRHVATLLDANGRPFSLVVESYTSEVLAAVNRR